MALPPLLTIVVAASAADETFSRYFEHLDRGTLPDATEIIAVVDAEAADTRAARLRLPRAQSKGLTRAESRGLARSESRGAGHAALAMRWPNVTWMISDRPRLVPELWGLGVSRARGSIVVLTIPACLPSPDWAGRLLEAHQAPHAAIGGAIELASSAGVVASAVYFVRYTSYMRPFQPGIVLEVPGDNGSYKRERIEGQMEWIARRGFWETTINARLRAAGQSLWMDPAIAVVFDGHLGAGDFSRQRFRHGVVFGREKAARLGTAQRLVHLLAEPIVPLVMLLRVVRTLLEKRRHAGRCLVSLPLVCWFLVCWAAGEAVGLLSRPRAKTG